MRSVHNLSAQQQNRTSVSPAPNYAASNAHIAYMPSNQGYYAPKDEMKSNDGPVNSAASIGSLATFNASTSRLHGSDEGFVQPSNVNYRTGSRLTPSEENILNRNLATLPAAPQRAATPSSNAQPQARMQDGKYKCDYCPKTYKANANLQKHINDHHTRQINLGKKFLDLIQLHFLQMPEPTNVPCFPKMFSVPIPLAQISHKPADPHIPINKLHYQVPHKIK